MNKIFLLVNLDIQTVKPYFSRVNFIIYMTIGILVGFFSAMNPLIPIAAAMGYASGYINSAFNLGERHNLDVLRSTFSVTRKEAVLARYIYACVVNFLSAAVSFTVVSAVFWIFSVATGYNWGYSFLQITAMLAMLNFVQYSVIGAVQIPMYYKEGYAKAHKFSTLSYITYLTTLVFIVYIVNYGWGAMIDNSIVICLSAVGIWIAVSLLSYFVSCKLYEKRDL